MNAPSSRSCRWWLLPCLLAAAIPMPASDPDPLEMGEKAASGWIAIRLETARIDSAWTSERPLLESTVNGLKDRAEALEEKRDHVKAKTAKDREEIDAIRAKSEAAASDLRSAEGQLNSLCAKLVELRPSLPPRLSSALELSYRSIGNASLGTGERMNVAMTILNRCAQFDRTVMRTEEVLAIEEGQGMRSLDVIYWGLSHAYALDRIAGKAWYGSPGSQGWRWEARPDVVRPVTKLIAIYDDKADPEFVAIPAQIGRAQDNAGSK
jgi:hypothetical protein